MPVKVYDRPEGASKSPLLIVVSVIVLILLGYLVYRWKFAAPAVPANGGGTSANKQSSIQWKGRLYGHLA